MAHASTAQACVDLEARGRQWHRLYSLLRAHPPEGLGQGEVDQHFFSMPSRYWKTVTKTGLTWGLELVHSFVGKSAAAQAPSACVVADWRPCPERGRTKVMLCAWDKPGLLSKVAAAFSALRVNILRADVYTRADRVALDLFEVEEATGTARLQYLPFMVEGALSDPPRFVSLWAGQFHRTLNRQHRAPARVEFDNDASAEHTLVRVETTDRLGLLHDLLQILAEWGLNVAQAVVSTDDKLVSDQFYVTDVRGRKIENRERLRGLSRALANAVQS